MVIGGGLGPRNPMAKIRLVPEGRMRASTPQGARTSDRAARMLSPHDPSVISLRLMRSSGTSHSRKTFRHGPTGPRLRLWRPPGPKAVLCRKGCRYHGYKNAQARPSLAYEVLNTIEILEPLPIRPRPGGGTPITDYVSIMQRIDIRKWVERRG